MKKQEQNLSSNQQKKSKVILVVSSAEEISRVVSVDGISGIPSFYPDQDVTIVFDGTFIPKGMPEAIVSLKNRMPNVKVIVG